MEIDYIFQIGNNQFVVMLPQVTDADYELIRHLREKGVPLTLVKEMKTQQIHRRIDGAICLVLEAVNRLDLDVTTCKQISALNELVLPDRDGLSPLKQYLYDITGECSGDTLTFYHFLKDAPEEVRELLDFTIRQTWPRNNLQKVPGKLLFEAGEKRLNVCFPASFKPNMQKYVELGETCSDVSDDYGVTDRGNNRWYVDAPKADDTAKTRAYAFVEVKGEFSHHIKKIRIYFVEGQTVRNKTTWIYLKK